jgi:hypothetical protein
MFDFIGLSHFDRSNHSMHSKTSIVRKSSLLFAALGSLLFTGHAMADITGFGDGSGFTLNGYDQDGVTGDVINTNDPATISGGVLTITNVTEAQGRSAFYNTPQNVHGFAASFVFQDTDLDKSPLGAADGFAFVIQTQGLTAVGGTSAGLGYTIDGSPQPSTGSPITAIAPSAAEEFYLRNGNGATQFGVSGSGTFGGATSAFPVDLADGDPILITLVYDATAFQLTETLTDLTTADTYTLIRSADIQDVVGENAFVGFTGATGGAFTSQLISNFTFVSAVPEPASVCLLGVGGLLLAARRRRN